ncbi:GNAT family N-acetyltransferase [Chitinasiproducens palmae]|uniref:Protein N-acetyltransferase, RimJ/RimL family n=1 Tax=Chitinasiproducens palmae TaxID=1770053 RepID=A0A1H2PPU9_9BURK|nr:GNAT family N-acetyltransferase [Chitinasiproducens palmae]SDV48350.1 Protein N-acetyltransferase, RimJ/RimL family [Chitinasiproducens palmae]
MTLDDRKLMTAHGHADGQVLVRELSSADRDALRTHFLALANDDRLLRFGQTASDAVIEAYVAGIDFERDTVFGVYGDALQLIGVGHLGYLNTDGEKRTAEFGVSVLAEGRGKGIGSALFERAAMRGRNTGVTTLYMHCLSRNATMMHIATKAGMKIHREYGEADAYLTLPPADSVSFLTEMRQEQAALFDYFIKRHARQAGNLLGSILPRPAAA